jgi:hypothetical protein
VPRVALYGGIFHASRRRASSSSDSSALSTFFSVSIVMRSPVRMRAMGPRSVISCCHPESCQRISYYL